MKTGKTAEVLFASSDMYQALGYFLCRTEPELVRALCDGSYVSDIRGILGELGFPDSEIAELTEGFSEFLTDSDERQDALFHLIRRDYTNLFTNPKISVMTPYESRFLGEETIVEGAAPIRGIRTDVKNFYARVGFESSFKPKEYEDHMRVEFEFMQVLRKNQGISVRNDDESSYQQIESTIQMFFERHFKVWSLAFFEDVVSKSLENAYKVMGRVALAFLEQEFKR